MATIKEQGTIAVLGEIQSGVSQNGNGWARQQVIIDVAGYNGSFRKVALQAGTSQVQDMQSMQVGDKVEFSYQVTAREYNGRWYNNVDLFRIEQLKQSSVPAYPQNPQQMPQVNPQMYPHNPTRGRVHSTPQIPANTPMDLQEDDLPPSFYQQR